MSDKRRLKYNPKAFKNKKKKKPKMRLKGPDSGIDANDFYGETDKLDFEKMKFYKEYK